MAERSIYRSGIFGLLPIQRDIPSTKLISLAKALVNLSPRKWCAQLFPALTSSHALWLNGVFGAQGEKIKSKLAGGAAKETVLLKIPLESVLHLYYFHLFVLYPCYTLVFQRTSLMTDTVSPVGFPRRKSLTCLVLWVVEASDELEKATTAYSTH